MTSWTDHVKAYQQHHGCSYKQALSGASASYQPASSGAGLKSMARKAKNTTKRGMKMADTAMPYAQMMAQQAGVEVPGELSAAYGFAKQVNGGNLKGAMRKAKHTAQRVKKVSNKVMKVADKIAPYAEMAGLTVAPELVAAYEGAKLVQSATGGGILSTVGRKAKNTKNRVGESLTTAHNVAKLPRQLIQHGIQSKREADAYLAQEARDIKQYGHTINRSNGNAFPKSTKTLKKIGDTLLSIAPAEGGSFKAHGGSFKAHGGCMGQSCKSCGGSVHARSSSSMVHPAHHSFAPLKPKSFRQLQMVN